MKTVEKKTSELISHNGEEQSTFDLGRNGKVWRKQPELKTNEKRLLHF